MSLTADREIRLGPRGAGRFFSAAFLLFWLCGWAVGETIVLFLLVKGAIALATGTPPDPGREPLEPGPALAVGGFLLFWLVFWTFGGVMAIGHLVHLLWASDRLAVRSGALEIVRSRGPFRTRRSYPRDTIRRIALVPKQDRLAIETDRGLVELSTLGTREEREQALTALRTELGIVAAAADEATLPEGWQEIITPEGERALVQNLATRRSQGRVAGIAAVALATVTLLVANAALRDPPLFGLAAMALAATVACGWGTVWLARGRNEWRIGSGRIVLRRRFGGTVRDLFEARRLELDTTSDSDGDEWFGLDALGEGAAPTGPVTVANYAGRGKHRRTIVRTMTDSTVPRRLAAWLVRAADLPLEDRTTPQARELELAELRVALEASGRFGKWAAKLIDQVERNKKTG